MACPKKQSKSALNQLKSHTIVVADTGDFESMRAFKPTDATTNPSLILQAANIAKYGALIDEAVDYGVALEGDIDGKVRAKMCQSRKLWSSSNGGLRRKVVSSKSDDKCQI